MTKSNRKKQNSSKRKGKGWREEQQDVQTEKGIEKKAPIHRKVALEKEAGTALNKRMVKGKNEELLDFAIKPSIDELAFDLVIRSIRRAGRFAVPFVFSLAGVDDPLIVAQAGLNSFEDSRKIYKKTGNIDDAVISGVKSFVKNYIIYKAESYIANDFSLLKDDDDSKYEAALKGTIMMTSLYAVMENIA